MTSGFLTVLANGKPQQNIREKKNEVKIVFLLALSYIDSMRQAGDPSSSQGSHLYVTLSLLVLFGNSFPSTLFWPQVVAAVPLLYYPL